MIGKNDKMEWCCGHFLGPFKHGVDCSEDDNCDKLFVYGSKDIRVINI